MPRGTGCGQGCLKENNLIKVPYVDQILDIDIPEKNLLFDVGPRDVELVAEPRQEILQALRVPHGVPQLREMLRPGQKVVIISDDNTRRTPTQDIVPIVLDELNSAGIPDRDIRIVISSGTHRPMTEKELDEKYGPAVLNRVRILPHEYKNLEELVDYGTTSRGTRILVNRTVIEADFRLAVGDIIPHHPAGWGGGAKAVLPGVAGEETVAQLHFLGSRYPALGRLDSEMRREMEDFAEKIGLNFIVNTVLSREGRLVKVVAGHFLEAHRHGVEKAKEVYGVGIPQAADMTISSTSPVDFDFFQGDKGITSAELATRKGGEIVLVSGCQEGISPAHPGLADFLGRMSSEQMWERVQLRQTPDPLACAEAIVINDIRGMMDITIATEGLSPSLCRQLGLRHLSPQELPDYVQKRLTQNPGLKVGVIRDSAEILPLLPGGAVNQSNL
jgi:nickel-dependent lactate racemase